MSERERNYAVTKPIKPSRCVWCSSTHADMTIYGCWYDGMAYARGVSPAKSICVDCIREGRDGDIDEEFRDRIKENLHRVDTESKQVNDI